MQTRRLRLPPTVKSLSARLLLLTAFFVMLSEVFIYAPSVARYRVSYLQDKIENALLATLALEATPDNMISAKLKKELLDHASAYGIVKHTKGQPKRLLLRDMPPKAAVTIDLRKSSFFGLIFDAFGTLVQDDNRVLRILGSSKRDPSAMIELVIDEAPMRDEMWAFSWRILALSIIISLFTAMLVYLSLQWLMVRPLRRMTANMVAFAAEPEDAERTIDITGRSDEIGVVQRAGGRPLTCKPRSVDEIHII